MKYRIQFNAVFNNTDANDILNTIEGIKDKVYYPDGFTHVEIIRKTEKRENEEYNPTIHNVIDFDASQTTHSSNPSGETEFDVDVDISFDNINDLYDCLNYFESIKSSANINYKRLGRHFQCNHDEVPLIKDGPYTYMDFDGTQLVYSL